MRAMTNPDYPFDHPTAPRPAVIRWECAHCGQQIGQGDAQTHWEVCEHHPAGKRVRELEALALEVAEWNWLEEDAEKYITAETVAAVEALRERKYKP